MTPFAFNERRRSSGSSTTPVTHRIDSVKRERFFHPHGRSNCDRCGAPRVVVKNPDWTPNCYCAPTTLGDCSRKCTRVSKEVVRRRLRDYDEYGDGIYSSLATLFYNSDESL